jgi:fatty acid desaturase
MTRSVGHVTFAVNPADWLKMYFHKACWLVVHVFIPAYYIGWARALGLLVLAMVIGGYYLESIFIVNHIQDSLVPPPNAHWAVKQVLATSNWGSASPFWCFVSGGLNHQIEHHLFPAHSIYHYPYISPIVEQVCCRPLLLPLPSHSIHFRF